jgi:succinate dehydrogenase / fumarate reductase membrane anchor subunit
MAASEREAPSMQSQLGRARGLGSAKEGVAHWWAQRLSAVALIPLSLWFASAILGLAGADHASAAGWLSDP